MLTSFGKQLERAETRQIQLADRTDSKFNVYAALTMTTVLFGPQLQTLFGLSWKEWPCGAGTDSQSLKGL